MFYTKLGEGERLGIFRGKTQDHGAKEPMSAYGKMLS